MPAGLSAAEAAAALTRFGPNTIPEQKSHGVLWRIGRQLRDPMIMLLLGAAALTIAQQDRADTTIIALVVMLNTTVGVVQELRAEKSMLALRRMAAPHARVIRDGRDVVVAAAEVVPGDVLSLDAGDVVPADGDLIEAVQLQCDESALTGESIPVDKVDGGESQVEVFAGTTVTRGRGLVLVRRTGSSSALGKIAALVAGTRSRPTPLQRRLAVLGAQLSAAVVVLSAVVLVVGLARGRGLTEMTLTAVSLAVAAVPESLPAVVTLALALGARRMARRSALVRGLPAVETLGSVSTLATDKTGTLTENAMVVQRVLTPSGEYTVTGAGYGPDGDILPVTGVAGEADLHDDEDLQRLVRDVVLCNDANVLPPDLEHHDWRPVGDPTEAALVTFSAKAQQDVQELRVDHPRLEEVPFDGTRGWMATAHSTKVGTLVVYKGGADILLPAISRGEQRQSDAMVRAARWTEDCARDGLRVLAVAQVCHADGSRAVAHLDDDEGAVPSVVPHFVGLVAMADPPRADLRSLVSTLQGAGIRLVLITGDHPATASAVAREVGIADHGTVPVTGNDLRSGISPAAITGSVVFARIRPEQKLDIVRALQAAGQVVAMTGDGVNDAPALRAADIGVAMGRGGTEVARQAADVVLTDDHLTTVAAAVEEGRRIHDNVRRFLRYALSGGLAEIAFMLAAPFVGFAVPLLPAQILWINMLTHGLPGVAFGADPVDPAAMTRPPRPPREAILGVGLVGQIAATGALIVAATFGASVWARASGAPWQTTAFLVLGLAQLGVALGTRQPRAAASARNWFLDVTVAMALVLQLAGVYWSPLQELLGTESLTLRELPLPLVLAAAPGLVLRAARLARTSGIARRSPEGPSALSEPSRGPEH
jgi:Ca2+-transporting ATPase